MALVAIGPTHSGTQAHGRAAGPAASHGIWQIKFEYGALGPACEIDAWIERDDCLRPRQRRAHQSFFVGDQGYVKFGKRFGDPPDNGRVVKRHGSFNTIATGTRTIVVGGSVARSSAMAPYSGSGPTRNRNREGPTVCAVAEAGLTLPGLRSAGTRGGITWRMNGTSVATPRATRKIANGFATGQLKSSAITDVARHLVNPPAPPPAQPKPPGQPPAMPKKLPQADERKGHGLIMD
jgi:hypothetical protein